MEFIPFEVSNEYSAYLKRTLHPSSRSLQNTQACVFSWSHSAQRSSVSLCLSVWNFTLYVYACIQQIPRGLLCGFCQFFFCRALSLESCLTTMDTSCSLNTVYLAQGEQHVLLIILVSGPECTSRQKTRQLQDSYPFFLSFLKITILYALVQC